MNVSSHQDKSLSRRGIFKKSVVVPEKKAPPRRKFFTFKKPSFPKSVFLGKIVKNKKRTVGLAFACLVLIGGGAGYWLYEYNLSQNPAFIYQKKLQTLTKQVSQSVELPTNETPITATVTDITKLPKEPFFALAQNGDKILMYKKNKKAILYRPSTGRVITEAVLDFQNLTPKPAVSQTAVAGASTSASATQEPAVIPGSISASPSTNAPYHPDGKILIAPQQ